MITGFLDHIRACNAGDLADCVRFFAGGKPVGWLSPPVAAALEGLAGFEHRPDGWHLTSGNETPALDIAARRLVDLGIVRKLRGEAYRVVEEWGAPEIARIDRGAAPYFGLRSFGIHLNGFVRRADGIWMWVATRAMDRALDPGKLDNLVAGGQPAGLSAEENMVKEAAEEADIPAGIARQAVPVGAIRYCLRGGAQVRRDTLFLYDLELPESFRPHNADGEVARFDLMPLGEVAEIVRTSDRFKFNCGPVVIDFLIRHGYLRPEHEDYLAISTGLRRSFD
ncbi:DUF4743 domain-containing protein [Radicibacter daui]|uniref:DUF4743 domain-containing protein n=1 Tax=Radicibacter daui TaxID=3064829 RepID=UPI004046C148